MVSNLQKGQGDCALAHHKGQAAVAAVQDAQPGTPVLG